MFIFPFRSQFDLYLYVDIPCNQLGTLFTHDDTLSINRNEIFKHMFCDNFSH